VYSLVITGTTSFEGAEEVCDRRQRNPAAWSRRDKINGLGKDLYPINYFSTVQMFATTLCVLLWLFFSPHNKPEGATLDKSCKPQLHFQPATTFVLILLYFYSGEFLHSAVPRISMC
jgi:hypothetical protein